MAYENGRKVNRYAAKQIGKRKQMMRNISKRYYWNSSAKYWKSFYHTNARLFAKRETNRKIRQSGQEIPNGAGYQKMFDYEWTIW